MTDEGKAALWIFLQELSKTFVLDISKLCLPGWAQQMIGDSGCGLQAAPNTVLGGSHGKVQFQSQITE